MAETIRNVTIRVNLEQGTAELKAPDLSNVIRADEKRVQLAEELERAHRAAAQAQVSVMTSGGGRLNDLERIYALELEIARLKRESSITSNPGASQDYRLAAMDRLMAAEDELQRVQERAGQKAAAYYRQAFEGANQAAEGVFRLGRAAVLLGTSSDESFNRMVKGLAEIQAYFDLFRGSVQIILGVQKAMQSLTMARALDTAATEANTVAQAENTAAMGAGTAAATKLGLAAIALYAFYRAGADTYDLLTTSEEEANEATQRRIEWLKKLEEASQRYYDLQSKQLAREQQINDARRAMMGGSEQVGSLLGDADSREALAGVNQRVGADLGGGELATAESAYRLYNEALQLQMKALEAAKQHRDEEIGISQEKTSQIEQQERIVEAAERQLQIEKQKQEQFRIQFGMLSQFEQEELKRITDKLKAGQDIDAFEENTLATIGGPGGENIVNARAGRRGEAAGADDLYDGIKDAGSGLKDAEQSFSKATKALEDLAKALTGVSDPAAAKAKLEAERAELEKQYQDFYKKSAEAVERLVTLMTQLDEKIRRLEEGVANGGI